MSKSSAGRFFYLTTRRNAKWFSGKSTSTKKDDVDGQGLKKRYTVKELDPEVTGDISAVSRMSLLQPCLQQNRLPRSTELVIPRKRGETASHADIPPQMKTDRGGTKTLLSAIFVWGHFTNISQIQKNFWRIFGFEIHTWKFLSSRWIFRIRVSKRGHPRVTELPVAFLVARPLCVACCQKTPRWTR